MVDKGGEYMVKNKYEEISKQTYRTLVTFAEVSTKDKPMGRFEGLPVFVNGEEQPAQGSTYECNLNHSVFGNFYQAALVRRIQLTENPEPETPKSDDSHILKMLTIHNGVLFDSDLGTTNLRIVAKTDNNGVILNPSKFGELRCQNGFVDVTSILRVFGNRNPRVYRRDDCNIVFEFGGAKNEL